MKLARSVAKKTMASAISSAVAGRPAGAWAANCSSPSPMASVPSVRVGPGLTALTRTPLGPYSAAHVLVSRLRAALLEPKRLIPGAPYSAAMVEIDDGPFASLRHQRRKCRDEEVRHLHIQRIHALKEVFRHVMRRPERVDPGIVDQDIDLAVAELDG